MFLGSAPDLLLRKRLGVGQHVGRHLMIERDQRDHLYTRVSVANLEEVFPGIGLGLRAHVGRLVALAPVERSAVIAVASRADVLEYRFAASKSSWVYFDI